MYVGQEWDRSVRQSVIEVVGSAQSCSLECTMGFKVIVVKTKGKLCNFYIKNSGNFEPLCLRRYCNGLDSDNIKNLFKYGTWRDRDIKQKIF